MPVLELQRAAGNRASALAIRTLQRRPRDAETTYRPDAADDQVAADGATIADTATPDKPKPKKVTGFLGMNPDARKELKALRKGAGEDAVLATTGDADLEAKLSDEQAITNFVFDDLGISPGKYDRWSKAIDALTAAGPFVRDALGELMR